MADVANEIEAASLLLYLTIMYRVISIMILTHLFVYFSDEDDGLAGEEESEVKHVKKRPKVTPLPPHTHTPTHAHEAQRIL